VIQCPASDVPPGLKSFRVVAVACTICLVMRATDTDSVYLRLYIHFPPRKVLRSSSGLYWAVEDEKTPQCKFEDEKTPHVSTYSPGVRPFPLSHHVSVGLGLHLLTFQIQVGHLIPGPLPCIWPWSPAAVCSVTMIRPLVECSMPFHSRWVMLCWPRILVSLSAGHGQRLDVALRPCRVAAESAGC
jgi:hypothetical protein